MVLDGTLNNIYLGLKRDYVAWQNRAAVPSGSFNPDYISAMKTLNPRGLRTVNWNYCNGNSNLTLAAYEMPEAYWSYWGNWCPTSWCGDATGTNDYQVTLPGSVTALTDGLTVQCRMVNASSVIATFAGTFVADVLTVTGVTGTIAIGQTLGTGSSGIDVQIVSQISGTPGSDGTYKVSTPQASSTTCTGASLITLSIDGGATKIPVGNLSAALYTGTKITANTLWTFIYDATLGMWLSWWDAIQTGVPLSVQVKLCNTLNIDLYHCWPPHATDTLITAWSTYIRDNLNKNLTCYYEFSDETWNNTLGFPQSPWSIKRGQALGMGYGGATGSGQNLHGWYGYRLRQIGALIATAYAAASQTNYCRLLAGQAFSVTTATGQVTQAVQLGRWYGTWLAPLNLTITGITTAGVVTSTNHGLFGGQRVVLSVTGTGAIAALSGQTVYVGNTGITGSTFQLSSNTGQPGIDVPIVPGSGTFTSGSMTSYYSTVLGLPDYSGAGNRPVDYADAFAYATYFSGSSFTSTDNNYCRTQSALTINAASDLGGGVTRFTTSTNHGYNVGDQLKLTSFVSPFNIFNFSSANPKTVPFQGCYPITNVNSLNTFDIAINSAGLTFTGTGTATRYVIIPGTIATAASQYAGGSTAAAIATVDADVQAGTNYSGGTTASFAYQTLAGFNTFNAGAGLPGIYGGWEAGAAAFDSYRTSQGMPLLKIIHYEGGLETAPPDINGGPLTPSASRQLGLVIAQTATLNIGNVPGSTFAVHCVGHGLTNGCRVGFNSSGALPTGINNSTDYFVMNAGTDDYDISNRYYNPVAILLTGSQSGTQTATSHTIDNLIDGYKKSAAFQATVKLNLDNYFGYTHSYLGAWYEMSNPDQWALMPDLYATPFSSYTALSGYHFP